MTFSSVARRLQLVFSLGGILAWSGPAAAQEKLVLKDGRVQEGAIAGVSGDKVELQVGAGKISFPLSQVAEVSMPVPAAYAQGKAAFDAGDSAKAQAQLKGLVEKYKGLPLDWAKESMGLLAETYLAAGDLKNAEALFTDFQNLYPGGEGANRANVGLARLAVEKKDLAAAKAKLEPILQGAAEKKTVGREEGVVLSQAFYLAGRVAEGENKLSEALQDYLRVVTLYPHDPVALKNAQERAAAIRKTDPTIRVP